MKKDIVFCVAHKMNNMREEKNIYINNQSHMANKRTNSR